MLSGPSASLAAGVRNPLAGVQLRRTVSVSGQTATVDLTGLATDPAPVLSEVSAQLVWTLHQTLIRTVVVLVDGQPIHISGLPTLIKKLGSRVPVFLTTLTAPLLDWNKATPHV